MKKETKKDEHIKIERKTSQINNKEKKKKLIQILKERKILIIVFVCLILLIIIGIIILTKTKLEQTEKNRFLLNKIFDANPEEVRNLYSNMVSVSCSGDLHLDIKLDAPAIDVKNMNTKNLLDYLFSHMEKDNKLSDEMTISDLTAVEKQLFNGTLNLYKNIKDYSYGDYIYNVSGSNITRTKSECTSDIKYVSFLYGYSYNENELSVDVDMGYVKDGEFYSLDGKRLGKYVDNLSKLNEMMMSASFYRMNYVKQNDILKLSSVEWVNRG